MKHITKILLTVLLLLPASADAASPIPWTRANATDTFTSPALQDSLLLGATAAYFKASSTTASNSFLGNSSFGTTTSSKISYIAGNQSGGISRVDRVTAGVAGGLFGTQDVGFWDTAPGNDLLGPTQTFTYVNGTTGARNILGQIGATRRGADNTGEFQIYANKAGVANQTLVVDGSNGDVVMGSSTPSNAADQCGNFTFCNVFISGQSAVAGDEAQWKMIASTSAGQVRAFANARDVDGTAANERAEFGTETNHNLVFFTNNTARMTLTKIGGLNIGPTYWNGATFPNTSGGLIVEGNTGIGTTTPGTIFSVGSIANFSTTASVFYTPVLGKMRDEGGQVYNVAAYGAKCDGTTDDTAAINIATSSMPSQGGTLAFPAGVCRISYSIQPPQQSVVEGSYLGTTIEPINNSNTAVFVVKQNHVVIQNIGINGNSANESSGDGIQVIASFQPIFQNIYEFSIHDMCFDLIGTFGVNSLVHIENSTCRVATTGITVDASSQDTVIDNFYAEDITGTGIVNNGNGTSMTEAHIYHANVGISDTGDFRAYIANPIVEHNHSTGILFTNSTNPQIIGGRIFDNASLATGTASAIDFAGTTNGGIVSGAVIYDDLNTQQYGIVFRSGASGNTAGSNQISGVASSSYKDLNGGNQFANTSGVNFGLGTSTPTTIFSIAGTTGFFASTTATSTFQGGGINLITAAGNTGCFAVNGVCIGAVGGSASSTLLGDNNTFSGADIFFQPLSLTSTTGSTTLASGQGFTVGATQFVVQQGSGNIGIATSSPATKFIDVGASANMAFDGTNFGIFRSSGNGAVLSSGGVELLAGVSGTGGVGSLLLSGPDNTSAENYGVTVNSSSNRTIRIGNTGSGNGTVLIGGTGITGTGTGLFGINATTSPGGLLGIAGSAAGTSNLLILSTSTAAFATSTVLNIDSKGNTFLGLNGSQVNIGTTTTGNIQGSSFNTTNGVCFMVKATGSASSYVYHYFDVTGAQVNNGTVSCSGSATTTIIAD